MYTKKVWTMRQYAGFVTAAESNERYHFLLKQGQTGLSVAFDLPTQIGMDSDHALAQGEVQFVFATPPAAMAQIKTGRVKILATSNPVRLSYLPDVPTFVEAGLPGIDVMPWQGFLAPANTPRPIVMHFNAALNGVLKEAETSSKLAIAGSDVVPTTPEALGEKIRKELAYFSRVIKAAKIKPAE